MFRAPHLQRVLVFLSLLVISLPWLGSSPTLCQTGGDIYSQPYDMTGDFIRRWSVGEAQYRPQWTPTGSHIVFGHAGSIFVVDVKGSELRSLSGSYESAGYYTETEEIDFSPTLSPDGRQVAYTTLRYAEGGLYGHTYEIATQTINGKERRRVTVNFWNDVSPS